MKIRIWVLFFLCISFSHLILADNTYKSKVVDLGRVIYDIDESSLLSKMQGFEEHTNVVVKIYTTFRLHKNYDVSIVFTKELSGDNTIAIVVQTGWLSTLTDDYEPSRYKDDLHIDRTENLNKENLLPSYMVEEIRKRMITKFNSSTNREASKNLYYSLDYGVELLASLIYNPVAVKGSLIWESLWNRADPYIVPEIAGFIDGCYNTYKAIPETDEAVEAASELARDFAFNYALNRDGYRDAVNELVTEAVTDLDTYIKLANAIVAAEDKIVNIYKGTSQEDRYWRGIIVFEVASAIFPLSKTKAAAKTASGIRGLLDDLRKYKVGKLSAETVEAVKTLRLGKFLKKIGDYEVYENGEVFYRGMKKADYDLLLKNKKLVGTSETFTSPTIEYVKAGGYGSGADEVIVKFQMKPGTLKKLESIGVRNDATQKMLNYHPEMPPITTAKDWTLNNALFKTEGKRYVEAGMLNDVQVNIGLGKGEALNRFNEGIIDFVEIID